MKVQKRPWLSSRVSRKNLKLASYYIIYSAQAEFSKKLGLKDEAIQAYQRAIELVRQESEKRYLKQQLENILK